ncbi:putative SMODS and SLOG-associating 2TM effector domain-containing protein [Seiridium unicorne]|uniref:SMODS and SLOG-associating 2TM effector domain-containing protein n=1 Tax=Seiridium unicorne TaxID=138068 RepID=A0ABR2V0J2_9PEZI
MSSPKKDVNSPLLSPSTKNTNAQVSFTSTVVSDKAAAAPKADNKLEAKPMASNTNPPTPGPPRKVDTNMSWGLPLGLGVRGPNDENLIIFRKAVGINWAKSNADNSTLEEGRKTATGIYKLVLDAQTSKHLQHDLMTALQYVLYLSQIVVGAALTALGPTASSYTLQITILGAVNTIVAGVLALIKGSGQPQRLGKDQMGYRKLQDWIEETEALLAVGIIGRDRREVGALVEVAFKRYNAAKASEENNRPDMYVYQPLESLGNRASSESLNAPHKPSATD